MDEGPKDAIKVIVCLHGEPSWSFLYRKMIPIFVENGYRVVALDFIGFGKSDKFTNPNAYSYDLHRGTFATLCQHLNLTNIVLVVQDWGGIIGLGCVPALQDRISDLVIMNTALPTGKNKPSLTTGLAFVIWLLFARTLEKHMPVDFIFKSVLKKSTPEIIKGYNAPFPNASFKAGVYQFPLLVPFSFLQVTILRQHTCRQSSALKTTNPTFLFSFIHNSIPN